MRAIIGLDTVLADLYDGRAMTPDLPPRTLSRCDWVRRCAAAIRELDDVVTLIDAADLASTLRDLPCSRDLAPEAAAARLFRDDLTRPEGLALPVRCAPSPRPRP